MNEAYKGEAIGWDDPVEKGQDYILLPEGEYDFVIESFERSWFDGSEKAPACPKAELKLKVETPEGICILNESLLLYNKMQWKIAEFFISIGFEPDANNIVHPNWSMVARAAGRAAVEIRPDRNEPTKKYNHVKKFLPKQKKEYKAGSF